MNKRQQRELENKIREAIEEPAELTEDEIADIRNRAYRAYQKKMDDRKQPSKSGIMKSGLLRRVVAVFAIAVGLIVMSVVYSVIAPVTSSSANSFVRRAAIWVNDQLHLGISFPVPEEEPNGINIEQNSFSSIQEASKVLDMPIVIIRDDVEDILFSGIETVPSIDNSLILFIHYKIGGRSLDISVEKFRDGEIFDNSSSDITKLLSPIGEVFIWETEEISRAITFYNGYFIEFYGHIPLELLLTCCKSLDVIN